MRIAALALIGALGLAIAAPAHAAPFAPPAGAAGDPAVVKVWGGCGPGWRPVPGHWTRWRGWVPPHCAPAPRPVWRPYAYWAPPYGWYHRHWW